MTSLDNLRCTWDWDPEPDFALMDLDQWDTPEKYAVSPMMRDGKELTFVEYLEYYGDPRRHCILYCRIETKCPYCDEWSDLVDGAVFGVDFMDDDGFELGTQTLDDMSYWSDYQREIIMELVYDEIEVTPAALQTAVTATNQTYDWLKGKK